MQRLKFSKIIKILSILIAILSVILSAENYTPPESQALSCSDFQILYLHDLTEQTNGNNFLSFNSSISTYFAENLNKSYQIEDLEYLESPISQIKNLPTSNTFDASDSLIYNLHISREIDILENKITQSITTCPNSDIILIGFSSGAHIVTDTLTHLDKTSADHIFHVSLLGNPTDHLLPSDSTIPDYLTSKIHTYCTPEDIYCTSGTSLNTHYVYDSENLLYTAAVNIGHHIEQAFKLNPDTAPQPALPYRDTAVVYSLHNNMEASKDFWHTTIERIRSVSYMREDSLGLYYYGDMVSGNNFRNPTCTIGEECDTILYERATRNPSFTYGRRENSSALYGIYQTLSDGWRKNSNKSIVLVTNSAYYEDDLCWAFEGECKVHYDDILSKLKDMRIKVYVLTEKPELESVYKDLTATTGGQFYTTAEVDKLIDTLSFHPTLNFTQDNYIATAGTPLTLTLDAHDNDSIREINLDLNNDGYYEKKITNTYEGFDCVKEFTITFDTPEPNHVIHAKFTDMYNRTSNIATTTINVQETTSLPANHIDTPQLTELSIPSDISISFTDTTTSDGYLVLINNTLTGYSTEKTLKISNLDRSTTNTFTIIPIKNNKKGIPTHITLEREDTIFIPKAPNTGTISL